MNTPRNKLRKEKLKSKQKFTKSWLPDLSFSREQLIRSMPFVLFMAFWMVIYIANRHYAEKTERSISRLSNEVKDMRADYLTTKAELMFETKQSEVAEKVESLGLEALKTPPEKIKINK